MDKMLISSEADFKKWIKEIISECLQDAFSNHLSAQKDDPALLNRKEIAAYFRISLVTLTDWMKRGLPHHRQRGRVYFVKDEVVQYIKQNKLNQALFGRLSSSAEPSTNL